MNIVNINPSVSVVSALNEPIESCFQTVVLEKTLESSLDSKEIKPFNPKGNQPWIFIERTDAVDEAPVLWPPDVKIQLIQKDPDAGKDQRQEKGATEVEMVRCPHQFIRHEFEQTLRDTEGQGSLACCRLWGCKELDTTERLNNNEQTSESGCRGNISQHNKSHLWHTQG